MGGYAYLNCKYCAILYRGVEHLLSLVSMGGPGTSSPQILRDDCMYFLNFCLFTFGCAGSSLLHVGFLWLWCLGATLWLW